MTKEWDAQVANIDIDQLNVLTLRTLAYLLSPRSAEILSNSIMLETKCNTTVVIKVITHLFAEAGSLMFLC